MTAGRQDRPDNGGEGISKQAGKAKQSKQATGELQLLHGSGWSRVLLSIELPACSQPGGVKGKLG